MTTDFIIVGGGIGGAVLAGLLGRAGKRVIVLERNLSAPTLVRPEVLWPSTMNVLFSLLPRERWEQDAALPLRGIEFHDGRRVVSFFSDGALRDARAQPWSTDPNRTREHLLALDTIDVRRGMEVISILKEHDRVVGVRVRNRENREETELLADCTVGDDGAQSMVRQACGIPLDSRMFPLEFMCFGGSNRPVSVATDHARVWWNAEWQTTGIVCLLMVPLPEGRCAGLIPIVTKTFNANLQAEAAWQRFCAIDSGIASVLGEHVFPTGLVRVARPWGHAQRYGVEGAVLLGDAAHPVSPAGGQGANMSVADAVVLAELAKGDPKTLLAEYERRRWHANARSIRPTRIAAWVWSAPPWASPVSLMPFVARRVGGCPSLQRRFLQSNAGLFQRGA